MRRQATSFSLILCGYLLCRYTALNRKVWEQVDSLVYFFLFPVLLFRSIVKSPLDLGEVLLGPVEPGADAGDDRVPEDASLCLHPVCPNCVTLRRPHTPAV